LKGNTGKNTNPDLQLLKKILKGEEARDDARIEMWIDKIAVELVGTHGIETFNQSKLIVMQVLDAFFTLLQDQNLELDRIRRRIIGEHYSSPAVVNHIAEAIMNYFRD
jgi:hypothetical protein